MDLTGMHCGTQRQLESLTQELASVRSEHASSGADESEALVEENQQLNDRCHAL